MATFPTNPSFDHRQFPEFMHSFKDLVCSYSALPHSELVLTGKMLERLLADSLGGVYTADNSLIDIKATGTGFQAKSTMQHTKHIVWRRVKVENQHDRIVASKISAAARQELGNLLIQNLNSSFSEAMFKHGCTNFSIIHVKFYEGDTVEVILAPMQGTLFVATDFTWEWSVPVQGNPVLYAINRHTNEKWFCWNGSSGNHFQILNEKAWLEDRARDIMRYAFLKTRREDRLTQNGFEELLDKAA